MHTEITQHADDLEAAVEFACKLRSAGDVGVLAWSYGNQYAGMYVATHSNRTRRYVAYAMHHPNSPAMIKRRGKLRWLQDNVYAERSEDDWRKRFGAGGPDRINIPAIVDAYAKVAAASQKQSPTGPDLDRLLSAVPWISPRLIKTPTMVVHGEFDDQADLDHGLDFFAKLPNPYKKYMVVPDVGHMAHLQKGYPILQREVVSWLRGP